MRNTAMIFYSYHLMTFNSSLEVSAEEPFFLRGTPTTTRRGNLWLVPLRNEKEDMEILMNHCTHVLVSF